MKPLCVCSYEGVYDEELIAHIHRTHGVPQMVARALVRRGVTEDGDISTFLNPSYADLLDPMTLPDMATAVARIHAAIERGERICIYGDYDADGVCATAILTDCLRGLGAEVFYCIPSRHDEGYGLHAESVDRIAAQGARLLITVDNGIAANEEAALCARLGLDLIVTDHHLPSDSIPNALAVIAATRRDSAHANVNLCGAGVALKLALALDPTKKIDAWLALAAVATVADVVPLLGENRTIVTLGLRTIKMNIGISALLACANAADRQLTSETIAFTIAPRLNAAGRMGDAARAVELLLATDTADADALAAMLEEENRFRRTQEQHILCDIENRYSGDQLKNRRSIVLHGSDWHLGVIGIVASKLCEQYHCPVLLFGERDGSYVGSCRSIPGINLHEILSGFSAYFEQFGGHARAAGITIRPEKFSAFSDELEAHLASAYHDDVFVPSYSFEEDALLSELSLETVSALACLAPFGEVNPEPVFRIAQTALRDVRQIGQQGTHLSATVLQGKARMRAVGFSFGARASELCMPGDWTMLCTPKLNTFGGTTTVELQLLAALPCDTRKLLRAFLTNVLYNTVADCDKLCALFFISHGHSPFLRLERDPAGLRQRFVRLRDALGEEGLPYKRLMELSDENDLWACCIFLELGFFRFDTVLEKVSAVQHPVQRILNDSMLYSMATNFAD